RVGPAVRRRGGQPYRLGPSRRAGPVARHDRPAHCHHQLVAATGAALLICGLGVIVAERRVDDGLRVARRQLGLIASVMVLALATWFSASAVVPALRVEWSISAAPATWLTASVQLGFVTGAVVSAVLNLQIGRA